MNNSNELFGEFVSASSTPLQPAPSTPLQPAPSTPLQPAPTLNQLSQYNNNYIVDNNIIYKKLIELEHEINNLKMMITNIKYTQPIFYPPPQLQAQPQLSAFSTFLKPPSQDPYKNYTSHI